jgi:GT2 family glycosyltransferase
VTDERSDLLVVVVAYGGPDDLATCLHALDRAYPVMVVDNSSSGAVRDVTEQAGAHYVDPGANLGFAAGVNLALAQVTAIRGNILLLNPDAVVEPFVVEQLHDVLQNSPRLACVAPAQHATGSPVLDRVCWPFPTPARAWVEAIGLGRLRRRCDFLIGSVLLIRGETLIDIGGFDERFFLYAEETDWQYRAAQKGWSVTFCADAEAIHAGAGTDGDARRRMLRFHAGTERYVRKWHGPRGWWIYRMANIVGAGLRSLILTGARRRDARQRMRLYMAGPDAKARRSGVVPPPRSHVPTFSGEGPL